MSIEPGTPGWDHMNEAVDATVETITEGILDMGNPHLDIPSPMRHALEEMWEAAYEAGRLGMYRELRSEGLL